MKLTVSTPELLNSEEENILSVTNDLIKNHVLEINSKNNSEDPLSPLFEWAAEANKTDSECLIAKRV